MRFVGDIALDAEVRAIASGAITDGAPVVVNADGTVRSSASVTTTNTEAVTTAFAEVSSGHQAASGSCLVYDTNAKRFVLIFKDGDNSNYGTAIVIEINTSNFSLSYGTPVVFHSASIGNVKRSACFDSSNNKVVVVYTDSASTDGQVKVGTVDTSDNSISFGSAVEYAGSDNSSTPSICYDSTNNKVVIVYTGDYGGSNVGQAIVGTVSGTSTSFGSVATFEAASTIEPQAVHDVATNKIVIRYIDVANSYYGTGIIGTISGTSISFGTAGVYNSSTEYGAGEVIYDSTNNKTVFLYSDYADGEKGKARVVSISGTSISYGTEVTFESQKGPRIAATFDSNIGKVAIGYYDETPTNMRHITGTVSGTDISFGSELDITSDNAQPTAGCAAFDPNTGKVLYVARNVTDSSSPYVAVVQVGGDSTDAPLTSENFIGFANAAYADGQKATVKTTGSIARNIPQQASASSVASTAVVFESAATKVPDVCFDSTNNRIVVAYQDDANSDYGTAIVGTVASDGSISFGTPVVFESATTGGSGIAIVHDSNSNKIVIAYEDEGNSQYGTAIVGTVDSSDNSISFGSAVVFESGETTTIDACFDSNSNKVVIAYSDAGNSQYGKAVVGTVSGTSISFGSIVTFESAQTDYVSIAFDSTNNKVIIAYADGGDSSKGKAVVGTVSGTDISFGTVAVFENADTRWTSLAHDSNNQKTVIAYHDAGNSDYPTAIVGTVSGTDISFGTAVVIQSTANYGTATTFDSNINKIIITYNDYDGKDLRIIDGTVSGTSISFGTNALLIEASSGTTLSGLAGANHIVRNVFDSNVNKTISVYSEFRNSSYGTAIAATSAGTPEDLTIGQQYFVQTDGTLGTSADDPSVIAGTAIGTSDIIVKG